MDDVLKTEPGKYESVFWIETEKVKPNPYQPRREFDEGRLKALAESIRQYGILQPLVVTRREVEKTDGGLATEYELIAGERRLRASRLIGLKEVPVVIRTGEESGRLKLEIAIIENLQREDLNPIDRAQAFKRLVDEFGLTHAEVGERIGKSREYVSNSLRLLLLPENIQQALASGQITEGHTRPLLMLSDKPEEQETLFREILLKKLNVRDSEHIARSLAHEKSRKKGVTPELVALERSLTESLGTRVYIEPREKGGKLVIEYFSGEDLDHLADYLKKREAGESVSPSSVTEAIPDTKDALDEAPVVEDDPDLYSVKNFSI